MTFSMFLEEDYYCDRVQYRECERHQKSITKVYYHCLNRGFKVCVFEEENASNCRAIRNHQISQCRSWQRRCYTRLKNVKAVTQVHSLSSIPSSSSSPLFLSSTSTTASCNTDNDEVFAIAAVSTNASLKECDTANNSIIARDGEELPQGIKGSLPTTVSRVFHQHQYSSQTQAVGLDDRKYEEEYIKLCAKSLKKSRCRRKNAKSFYVVGAGSPIDRFCNNMTKNDYSLRMLVIIVLSLIQMTCGSNAFLASVAASDALPFSNSTDDIYNANNSGKSLVKFSTPLNNGLNDSISLGSYMPSAKTGGFNAAKVANSGYLEKLDNIERSLAAVLIKVAYGTTSTTKRSIPENSYVPSLTTIATPSLTTLRYNIDKPFHHSQLNSHHRNYELDLERDHALPTSAPNADILKSNSNPTYPNPNRHHNHDRERHRYLLNSTPLPSLPNILKKNNGQLPTIPMFPGDISSYSPPARSFFTPPLPPEYQHPFADKPTLRGTNNEAGIVPNTGTYINRRPIPPPSLMPGHERIPFRPPDLANSAGSNNAVQQTPLPDNTSSSISPFTTVSTYSDDERKKALNTPSRLGGAQSPAVPFANGGSNGKTSHYDSSNDDTVAPSSFESGSTLSNAQDVRKEVLPSIRRILSGSNGKRGDIPDVLLKQVTSRPVVNNHQPPSSPVVLTDSTQQHNENDIGINEDILGVSSSNINKSKNVKTTGEDKADNGRNDGTIDSGSDGNGDKLHQQRIKTSTKSSSRDQGNFGGTISSTPSAAAAIGSEAIPSAAAAAAATTTTLSSSTDTRSLPTSSSSSTSSTSGSAAAHTTWTIAWNIHVYLSVILFTILAVYSFYKMITYNKLTHLFSQSYFVCIHLILITICTARIFYLCYDAYNIHSSFHIFVSEILLNLPATFLTISFSVLILFLSLKSLNHKNNRYSALIRPLTVIVGCGVHVVLCITLHYVESYTLKNHQQHVHYQQQQQLFRRQQLQQHHMQYQSLQQQYASANLLAPAVGNLPGALHQTSVVTSASVTTAAPPRVLSLICQIIYIFVCFSLGLLYLQLYRILKRILRSKSQNYIHGYQNLSYAMHITIATALLFILLAALQIFGAISISTTRSLIARTTAEIDWLQWGYQFSLRLIEIAIVTLISWVAGLKIGGGGTSGGGNIGLNNGEANMAVGSGDGSVFGSGTGMGSGREKHGHHNHSNVAGFFLPCTSSSSQEQFDTDYPAVCNANTNLHTYTMRTGKLIYDDSFALNSLVGAGGSSHASQMLDGRNTELQILQQQQQQPTYQHPYDTGSLHSSTNHNVSEYGSHSNRYPYDNHQHAEYSTDATTDHYENPNFDLHGSASGGIGTIQKLTKTSTASTTASSSAGSGSSTQSQQQMLILQSDSCYSEPLQQNYDFNNFERPQFGACSNANDINGQLQIDSWPDPPVQAMNHKCEQKKSHTTLDRCAYEKPERRSSNSTHSCSSSVGGGSGAGRYAGYNSFDRGPYSTGVRKSDTFNNIVTGSGNGVRIMHGRNASSSSTTSSISCGPRGNGIQTLASTERHHHAMQQHGTRGPRTIRPRATTNNSEVVFARSVINRSSATHKTSTPGLQQQYSDDDDIILAIAQRPQLQSPEVS